jgi:hypothetical protein
VDFVVMLGQPVADPAAVVSGIGWTDALQVQDVALEDDASGHGLQDLEPIS